MRSSGFAGSVSRKSGRCSEGIQSSAGNSLRQYLSQ